MSVRPVVWLLATIAPVLLYGFLAAGLLGLGVGAYLSVTRGALAGRVVNETVRVPLSPPSSTPWMLINAFGDLKFFEPTCVVELSDGSGRYSTCRAACGPTLTPDLRRRSTRRA